MADGAGKLDKLARLKNLKSGMKAKSESSGGDREDLSLDAMLGGSNAADPAVAPKPVAAAPSQNIEKEGESLSAYFEALGIVPDGAKLAGATGMAPKPYAPPSEAYTHSPEEKGRDVDARDRWPDPVREDDAFLTSFAGVAKPEQPEHEEKIEDDLSLESIIGSFEDDKDDNAAVEVETAPVAIEEPEKPEEIVELTIEDMLAEEMAAELPAKTMAMPASSSQPPVAPVEEPVAEFEPEAKSDSFGQDVDIEAFEREIGLADAKSDLSMANIEPEPVELDTSAHSTDAAADQPLSITFDETRATLLAHVSKQMNCSIDDVVVTAIDWYLDALFGEDDPAMKADAAE